MRSPLLASVLVCLLPTGAWAQEGPQGTVSIAVTDLAARGVDEVAAAAMSTEVTNTLASLGVFSVISGEDIKRLLALEATRQACTGNADAACLAEIGGALGVDYLIYGEVAKLGEVFSVSLTLLDTAKATAVSRANRKVEAAGRLLTETEGLTKVLVRSLLQANRGFLVVSADQPDARIKIDGRVVGVSPLPRRVELAMGPHDVVVEKAGFVTWARTVEVPPDRVVVANVIMVPSQAFIDEYEGSASVVRAVAWATAGLAVATLGTAGVLRLTGDARFDDLVSRRFIEQTGACGQGDPTFSPGDFCPTELGRANSVVTTVESIERSDNIAIGLAIGGVLSAAVSTVMFLTGDPPGRYTVYTASGGRSVGFAATW